MRQIECNWRAKLFHSWLAVLSTIVFWFNNSALLHAQTWTNTNATAQSGLLNWGSATNWSPNVIPNGIDSVALFMNSPNLTINNSQTYTNGTLSAPNSGQAWIVKYGTGTNYLQVSSGIPTLNVGVAGTTAWFQGAYLAGTQGFLKTGAGKMTFRYNNNVNSISGPIIVGAGTLSFQIDGNLGNPNNSLTLSNGAALFEESSANGGVFWLSPTRTITLAGTQAQIGVLGSAYTLVIPGVINENSAGSGLLWSSAGELVLSNANTFTGPMTMTTGTNDLANQNAVQFATLTVNGGTLLFDQAVAGNAFTFGGLAGNSAAVSVALQNTFATPQPIALNVGGNNANTSYAGVLSGAGSLTKTGSGTLTLAGANTYVGATTINAGTLAVAGTGSINNSAALNISAGATFDVSAINAYSLSGSTSLTARGNTAAAIIKGASGGTVNLGSQPITLNYDGSDPTLVISQGTLFLGGQIITVNTPQPLTNGVYNLISQTTGNIALTGSCALAGTAGAGTIAVNGGNVQMTITGSAGGSINPPTIDISANEADAFELYLLANQSQFPYDATMVAGDDTSVGNYVAALSAAGQFSDITYPTSPTATVVQGGGGWEIHLQRLVRIYQALISTTSAWRLSQHPEIVPNVVAATTAYTHVPWDITDQWNYVHTWADLNEVYDLGSVCLYARQINRLSPGLIPVSNIDAWGNRIPDLFRGGHIDTTYMVPSNGVVSAAHQANLLTGGNMIWTSQGIVLKYLTQSTNAVRLEGLDATFTHIWDGCSLIGPKHESPPGWPVYAAIPQMTTDYMLGEHYTPYLLVYGGTFLNGMISWRNGMANFPRWSMPPTNQINQRFADCMINGVAPVNQGYPDRVLLSRGLTVGGYYSPTFNLTTWLNNIIGYGYRTNELQQLLAWNNNNRPGATPWPFTNHTFTHFFSSDYSCQHYPNYLVTFRGVSQRTTAIENLQNPLSGYFPQGRQIFVPLGGSYIYATGNEYGPVSYTANSAVPFENSCDYTRIPGVTTKSVPDSAFTNYWRYVYGNLPFAGTAAANNSGVSGWEQSRYVRTDQWTNPISLSGNSAVFYLDMAVVHLGAGFDTTQDTLPTTTSLNQCLSATNVITYGLSGTTFTIPSTGGGVTNAAINWALYQGVGYLPPANGTKVLRDVVQNNLARMFSLYDDQSSPATNNLTFDWAVLPGVSQSTLASYSTPANRPWVIVTNTAGLQALSVPSENWLGAVFHTNTATLYASNLTISVSRPTVLLITTQPNQIATIYAADPFENMVAPYTNTVVPYTNSAQLVSQLTVTINSNAYVLTLPQSPYIGQTVVATVSLSSSNVAPVIVTQPASTNIVAGNVATFNIVAAGMPAPSYQWQRSNTNIAGATAASYSFAASVADNGASFTCVVSNSSGSVTSSPAVLSVNDTPVISSVADQMISRNSATPPLAFTVNDSQVSPGSLVVTATSSNPTLVPNANLLLGGSGSNRTLTVTPVANQTGYATINLAVSDGTLSSSTAFMVTVTTNSLPPILSPIANRAIIAGATLSVASQASDPNVPAQPLGFALPVAPAGARINPASGLITWRPLVAQSGTSNQFTVVVTNTASLGATQNFWVGVISPQPPVISGPNFLAGHFNFTVNGDAGPDYTIQGSTNLALPAWQSLSTSNTPTPPFQWTDTNAGSSQIYYRVLLGP